MHAASLGWCADPTSSAARTKAALLRGMQQKAPSGTRQKRQRPEESKAEERSPSIESLVNVLSEKMIEKPEKKEQKEKKEKKEGKEKKAKKAAEDRSKVAPKEKAQEKKKPGQLAAAAEQGQNGRKDSSHENNIRGQQAPKEARKESTDEENKARQKAPAEAAKDIQDKHARTKGAPQPAKENGAASEQREASQGRLKQGRKETNADEQKKNDQGKRAAAVSKEEHRKETSKNSGRPTEQAQSSNGLPDKATSKKKDKSMMSSEPGKEPAKEAKKDKQHNGPSQQGQTGETAPKEGHKESVTSQKKKKNKVDKGAPTTKELHKHSPKNTEQGLASKEAADNTASKPKDKSAKSAETGKEQAKKSKEEKKAASTEAIARTEASKAAAPKESQQEQQGRRKAEAEMLSETKKPRTHNQGGVANVQEAAKKDAHKSSKHKGPVKENQDKENSQSPDKSDTAPVRSLPKAPAQVNSTPDASLATPSPAQGKQQPRQADKEDKKQKKDKKVKKDKDDPKGSKEASKKKEQERIAPEEAFACSDM